MDTSPATRSHYNHTAWFYERLSGLYSGGKIRASKDAELQFTEPGDRILYAGAGGGEDAVGAAERGAEVTCIDTAPAMLSRAAAKLEASGLDAELIEGDILAHDRPGHYDVVCANYFLNIFDPVVMREVMAHLVSLLRPGGIFMIADFAGPRGGLLSRVMHFIYYRVANATFALLTRTPLHPVYDYEGALRQLGLIPVETIRHRLFSGGPQYFETIVARKSPSD